MWPLKMTDICAKVYIDVICFTRENIDFVVVVVVAYLHKWCQVIIGLGNVLASVRRQATTWNNTAVQRQLV